MQAPPCLSIDDLLSGPHVFRNLSEAELIRHCLEQDNCVLIDSGAVVAYSGKYTGRTPKDKYIVRDDLTRDRVWWGNNNAMEPEVYRHVRSVALDYLGQRPRYVVDTLAGAHPDYRIRVRFVVERAYHALFVRQLLIRPTEAELRSFQPDWTIVNAARRSMEPGVDRVQGDAVIALNMTDREVVVAGTQYAGELKKSVFTIMNFLLPLQGVMSMHCSANVGPDGQAALFFGLSGTGKTSLSADPERDLIGDDEHGWSDNGIFNIEGGCYAKCIGLKQESEPEIWDAIKEGAILENVVVRSDGTPDYADRSITENTRAAYPLEHISNAVHPSVGGHPRNIFFLTCDALGVLPPISRLEGDQIIGFFLNGYTAKVAGTEAGITEPVVTLSACFGQPFLPLPPRVYADLLSERIARFGSKVWLLNTGWTGGAYGTGHRFDIQLTRAMLHAVLNGDLDQVEFRRDPVFGLKVPISCPGVPDDVLDPRGTWPDPVAYDLKARELQKMFEEHQGEFEE